METGMERGDREQHINRECLLMKFREEVQKEVENGIKGIHEIRLGFQIYSDRVSP